MRKIYSFLPFNKFAIFALYGLLSVALITLAQVPKGPSGTTESGKIGDCLTNPLDPVPSEEKKITIGYVQLFTSQIDPKTIPWDKYDYINIPAYPSNDGQVYDIYRPTDAKKLDPIGNLVNFKKTNKTATKILLSLRNYDVNRWKFNAPLGKIIGDAKETIEQYGLDGIDIEYPGMRGKLCPNGWVDGDDDDFFEFLKRLRGEIGDDKLLMLTVGIEAVKKETFNDEITGIINYLNIETYHYSLYKNLKDNREDGLIISYPNSPFDVYEKAYVEWNKLIENTKIIMGVDFGNTIQAVDPTGGDISKSQNFKDIQFDVFSLTSQNAFPEVTPIKNYCSFANSNLYSWPWKSFTKFFQNLIPSPKFCADTTNSFTGSLWTRSYDQKLKTPWLYKPNVEPNFLYVSYEDAVSLREKLSYAISNSIGGMSISDVSYDDENNTLLDYMQVIRGIKSNGKGPPPHDSKDPKDPDPEGGKKPNAGVIAGSVIGVLAFVLSIGAFGYYRLRKNRLKSDAGNFTSKSSILAHKNELPPEPSPNRFVSTSVIPVASGHVTAMFDFAGREETDLSFKKGDIIEVLEKGDGPNDWWVGRVNGVVGEFPGNYVKET